METSSSKDEISKKAEEAELSLVPRRSETAYNKEFEKLSSWLRQKSVETVTEQVLLAYFLDQVLRNLLILLIFIPFSFISRRCTRPHLYGVLFQS